MKLGEFLSELRNERGLLQKEVANYLNVTVATISNYEKDVHSPDLNTLVKLADLFDVSVDYLLQRTNCRTNIDVLNRPLSCDYTVGDLLNLTLELDRHSIEALLDYCEMLRLRETARRSGHEGKRTI
jgi:transcriptional regulator with XRE-family HTH domain